MSDQKHETWAEYRKRTEAEALDDAHRKALVRLHDLTEENLSTVGVTLDDNYRMAPNE